MKKLKDYSFNIAGPLYKLYLQMNVFLLCVSLFVFFTMMMGGSTPGFLEAERQTLIALILGANVMLFLSMFISMAYRSLTRSRQFTNETKKVNPVFSVILGCVLLFLTVKLSYFTMVVAMIPGFVVLSMLLSKGQTNPEIQETIPANRGSLVTEVTLLEREFTSDVNNAGAR